jgi:hypothetical protein
MRAQPWTWAYSSKPTLQNAERVFAALTAFGYDLSDVTLEDLLTKKLLIRQYIEEEIGGTRTNFASIDDLIVMKQAAGRPKDLEDLRVLLRLREGFASEGEEDDS